MLYTILTKYLTKLLVNSESLVNPKPHIRGDVLPGTYVADLILCFLNSLQFWCVSYNTEALSLVFLKLLLVEHLQYAQIKSIRTKNRLLMIFVILTKIVHKA